MWSHTSVAVCTFSSLRRTQRLKARDPLGWLEVGLASVAGDPGVRLERAAIRAANADDDARIVSGAPQKQRKHCGAAQAAVAPDPLAAIEHAVDVVGEKLRGNLLAAGGNAREPCERAIRRKELERARHRRARGHDLELRAEAHASERSRRSLRAPPVTHFDVYVGAFASADTTKLIHMPLGACPGTPHAITY